MDEANFQDGKRVLVRDYTDGLAELLAAVAAEDAARLADGTMPEDTPVIRRALADYGQRHALPHGADPDCLLIFDELVRDCDALMEAFFGKLTAILDYEAHDARITMENVYLEFRADEFLHILQKMAAAASVICFDPTAADMLRVTVHMPCFFPLRDEERD